MVWHGKHCIISASQRDMPSHGGTCWVHGDLKGQRAVTMWGETFLLSWQLVQKWTSCHLAAFMETLARTFKKCSYYCLPLCGSMVDLWSVWMSSRTVQCYDRLLRSIRAHSQTYRNNFIQHPATKSPHCLIWSALCLGMSLNCHAEPARNSRLDGLYTQTFTSVDIVS